MKNILEFKDFGFKLAVINKLMYQSNVIIPPIFNPNALTPKFDAESYIENARGLKKGAAYDIIEEEGYDIIPELKDYFENLEITAEMTQDITELCSVGGDDIYHDIIPFWDGEDAVFDVKSAEDVKLIPNLKKATLLFAWPPEELIKAFKEQGVELDTL
jgi:hypothetical protein